MSDIGLKRLSYVRYVAQYTFICKFKVENGRHKDKGGLPYMVQPYTVKYSARSKARAGIEPKNYRSGSRHLIHEATARFLDNW